MSRFSLSRRVNVTAEQAFAIAANVGAYKDFLPLVKRSTVRNFSRVSDQEAKFLGDLQISFDRLGISESFVSAVETNSNHGTVVATSSDGPMKSLRAEWQIAQEGSAANVSICVDYVLKSKMLQIAAGGLVNFAAQKILDAFERRAKELYDTVSS